jgi:hypothetical protein
VTWRDIDFDLVLKKDPSDEIFWEVAKTSFVKVV